MIVFRSFYTLLVLFLGLFDTFLSNDETIYFLSLLLFIHNFVEISNLIKIQAVNFLLSPIIFSSFVTFGLAFGGISNFFLFEDHKYIIKSLAIPLYSEPQWVNFTMVLACISSQFTWLGYWSGTSTLVAKTIFEKFHFQRFLNIRINIFKLIVITIFAYLVKLYLFRIGLYGRLVSDEYFEVGKGFKIGSQIRIFSGLSYLTFVIICIFYFRSKDNVILFRFLFWVSLLLELFFAFIFGARGPFLIPFLIIASTYYYVTKKINFLPYLALGVIPLVITFSIVTEFKNYTLSPQYKSSKDPIVLVNDFLEYKTKHDALIDVSNSREETLKAKILGSTNFVSEAAMAIRHEELYGLSDSDPNPTFYLIMSPFDAFIPKFLQSVTQTPSWGLWFKNKVLNINSHLLYSIAMTPIGFLYFIGGPLMVFFGFWTYGVMLKVTYSYLKHGIIGFLVYISLFNCLYNFDSIFSATIVNFLRFTFIYPFIFIFVFGNFRRN